MDGGMKWNKGVIKNEERKIGGDIIQLWMNFSADAANRVYPSVEAPPELIYPSFAVKPKTNIVSGERTSKKISPWSASSSVRHSVVVASLNLLEEEILRKDGLDKDQGGKTTV